MHFRSTHPSSAIMEFVTIRAAVPEDALVLSELARETFLQSHGHSAPQSDIQQYTDLKYPASVFIQELLNPANRYLLLFYKKRAAGFSNIQLNSILPDYPGQKLAKLDRLYILQEFYEKGLGACLFEHNVQIARMHQQNGIWLYVWKENHRAVQFYKKHAFEVIGEHAFPISATHSNPNFRMFRKL